MRSMRLRIVRQISERAATTATPKYALMPRCVTGRTDGTVGSLAVGWAM